MREVNSSTFEQEVLRAELPVLVDFYAGWCGPCKLMAPVVHQLAEERADALKVVKVNVDSAPELAMSFGVSSIPTLVYFQGGQPKGASVGLLDREELERKLDEWGKA